VKGEVPLLEQVRSWLDRPGLDRGGGMVVAVSGGPDSVALLRALVTCGAGPLVVAHVNHQLRSAESDADQQFVEELARSLGLALRTGRIPVAVQAEAEGDNLESVGRRVRYDWLVGVAQATGCRWIATGHTVDDQAETVLHRVLRGTGLQGLRGIAPRREVAPGIWVVRPLLAVTRADVLAYLESINQPYRQDSSNLDPRFTRNRIRHELLPLLAERYNPAIAGILTRLAAQAEEAWLEIEALARELLVRAERPRACEILVFDRGALAAAPPPRVREMFRLVWVREAWPQGDMTFAAWDRLAALVHTTAGSLDLPGSVRADALERVVRLRRGC
jgi:tRNA(Ile)-lysidine synthase